MKNYLVIVSLFFAGLFLSACAAGDRSTKKATVGGWCSAGANCTACSNCSACKNCHREGGTCSVCCPTCYDNPAKVEKKPEKPVSQQKPEPDQKKQKATLRKLQIKT